MRTASQKRTCYNTTRSNKRHGKISYHVQVRRHWNGAGLCCLRNCVSLSLWLLRCRGPLPPGADGRGRRDRRGSVEALDTGANECRASTVGRGHLSRKGLKKSNTRMSREMGLSGHWRDPDRRMGRVHARRRYRNTQTSGSPGFSCVRTYTRVSAVSQKGSRER